MVSIRWEMLLGVRAKLYGKHRMGEVIRSEGQGCTVTVSIGWERLSGVRVKALW
jgi:hypothetical protein